MLEAAGLFLATGVVAGVIAGLLGVGGGLVIVPTLLWIFGRLGHGGAHDVQLAVGTSLATIVLTSLSSVHAHQQRGAVVWPVVRRLALGIIVGAFAGGAIASRLDARALKIAFGLFAAAAGVRMSWPKDISPRQRELPTIWYPPAGATIGAISSILGIGGGTLTVPFLTWARLEIRKAVGSSAACGFPIAVGGVASYAWLGQGVTGLPEHTFGFVHLPAFLCVAVTSIPAARLGAHWAHAIPRTLLRQVFGGLLIIVATRILLVAL